MTKISEIAHAVKKAIAIATLAPSKRFLFVLLLAILLRIPPILHGLKDSPGENSAFNTDEPVILSVVMKMVGQYSSGSSGHLYPTLYHYNIFFFGSMASAVIGGGYGTYLLAGRLVSLLYDVLSLIITYKIATELFRKRVGITSALIFALVKLHIIRSSMARTDTLMIFLILLTIFFSIRIVKAERRYKDYILAGICAGFAFSTRYLAIFAPAIIIVAHLLALLESRQKDKKALMQSALDRKIFTSIALFPVGFLLGSPSILLAPDKFLDYIRFSFFSAMGWTQGVTGYEFTSPLTFVERMVWGMGIALFVVAVLGILYHLVPARHYLKSEAEHIPFVWLIVYAVPIVTLFSIRAPQYLLPIYPVMIIYVGRFISDIGEISRWPRRQTCYGAVLLIISALSVLYVLAYDVRVFHDTRDKASAWMAANVPSNSSILMTQYVLIPPEFSTIKILDWSKENSIFDMDAAEYDYVIISSFFYERYLNARSIFPRERDFYVSLLNGDTKYVEVARFSTVHSSSGEEPMMDIYTFGLSAFAEFIQKPSSSHYGPVVTIFKLRE